MIMINSDCFPVFIWLYFGIELSHIIRMEEPTDFYSSLLWPGGSTQWLGLILRRWTLLANVVYVGLTKTSCKYYARSGDLHDQ